MFVLYEKEDKLLRTGSKRRSPINLCSRIVVGSDIRVFVDLCTEGDGLIVNRLDAETQRIADFLVDVSGKNTRQKDRIKTTPLFLGVDEDAVHVEDECFVHRGSIAITLQSQYFTKM